MLDTPLKNKDAFVKNHLKNFFRAQEQHEIKRSPLKYKYCVPYGNDSGTDSNEFLGLYSHNIYDKEGNLISDLYTEQQPVPQTPQPTINKWDQIDNFEDILLKTGYKGEHLLVEKIIAVHYGLELMERNSCPLKVYQFSNKLSKLSKSFKHRQKLSLETQKILSRSNYHGSLHLKVCQRQDPWANSYHVKHQSIGVCTNLLGICLMRGNYFLASKLYASLIRLPNVDIRYVWTQGLDILVNQVTGDPQRTNAVGAASTTSDSFGRMSQSTGTTTKKGDYSEFINWLILSYPKHDKSVPSFHEEELLLQLILLKLKENKTEEALEYAERGVNEPPYSSVPTYWAVCGLVHLKIALDSNMNLEYKLRKVQRMFRKCLQLGGSVPKRMKEESLKLEMDVEDDLGLENDVREEQMDVEDALQSDVVENDREKESGSDGSAGSDEGSDNESVSESESESESKSDKNDDNNDEITSTPFFSQTQTQLGAELADSEDEF